MQTNAVKIKSNQIFFCKHINCRHEMPSAMSTIIAELTHFFLWNFQIRAIDSWASGFPMLWFQAGNISESWKNLHVLSASMLFLQFCILQCIKALCQNQENMRSLLSNIGYEFYLNKLNELFATCMIQSEKVYIDIQRVT